MAHSKFSPSSAYRWINCPGSISLIDECRSKVAEKTNYASQEGTIGHHLSEMVLSGGLPRGQLRTYLGRWGCYNQIEDRIDYGATGQVRITEDLIEGIESYLDLVDFVSQDALEKHVEQRVIITPDIWGTADFIWRHEYGFGVIDLKMGRYAVSAEDNPQLKIYALGAGKMYGALHNATVNMMICQPRNGGAKASNPCYYEDLLAWENSVLLPTVVKAKSFSPPFAAGDWCKWCSGQGYCQEFIRQIIPHDLSHIPSGAELALLMDRIPLIERWIEAVKEAATDELLRGSVVPGYEIGCKTTQRKWLDPSLVVDILGELAYESSIVSPATALKMVSDPEVLEKLQAVITKPEGEKTIKRKVQ